MRSSYLANLGHAVHMEKVRSRRPPFLNWDTTPDLAQATWEWPEEMPYVATNVVKPFDFERCPCGCQMLMSAPSYEEAHRDSRHGLWF